MTFWDVAVDQKNGKVQQGSFNQVTSAGAVKQDLIISAYKPATAFVRQFELQAGAAEGAWAFVRQHLAQLPVVVLRQGVIEPLAERMPYLLFDRMVAFHIQRGLTVPSPRPTSTPGQTRGAARTGRAAGGELSAGAGWPLAAARPAQGCRSGGVAPEVAAARVQRLSAGQRPPLQVRRLLWCGRVYNV
jgi:hypothetical protein